jgi:hypothetical protein
MEASGSTPIDVSKSKKIQTAACMIVGDEVLGGKVQMSKNEKDV